MAISEELDILAEATIDCKHGIVTGMDVYPASEKESLVVLRHLEKQMSRADFSINKLALDSGHDTGAVHRGLELLGITGYIPAINFPNSMQKYGFHYLPDDDCFVCPTGKHLEYHPVDYIDYIQFLPVVTKAFNRLLHRGTIDLWHANRNSEHKSWITSVRC